MLGPALERLLGGDGDVSHGRPCLSPRWRRTRALEHGGRRVHQPLYEWDRRLRLLVRAVWLGGPGRRVRRGRCQRRLSVTYYNTCLSAEYAAAARTGNAALYINTGYDSSYTAIDGRHTTQACANSSQAISATPTEQAAWAVGCSEAQQDLSYAAKQSAASPTAWWLDVETANSWSSSDLSLNRYTIQGIVDTLRPATAAPIGIYSTSYQWRVITGGYQAAVDANWVATGQRTLKRAKGYCRSTGFTGAPVWLVQYVTTIDNDYVC